MPSDDYPTGEHHLTVARTQHEAIIAQLKAHGDSQVALMKFPTQKGRRGFGCDWRPSLATHAAMAAQRAHVTRTTLVCASANKARAIDETRRVSLHPARAMV